MRLSQQVAWWGVLALGLATASLRADPGDVENSHDYPGLPRMAGFVITDYDEDNPALFDFPIARPVAVDASHIDTVRVHGHRFVIRYELGAGGRVKSVYETQEYYEKLLTAAGFSVQKDGGVGDVTETFCKANEKEALWVYLEPSVVANVITVVESNGPASPPPSRLAAAPLPKKPESTGPTPQDTNPMTADAASLHKVTPMVPSYMLTNSSPGAVAASGQPQPAVPAPTNASLAPPPDMTLPDADATTPDTSDSKPAAVAAVVPKPDSTPEDTPAPTPAPPPAPAPKTYDDSLYQSLSGDGRVVVPFVFTPGRDDLDDSSAQDLIDRIVAMMKSHPDLQLRIEGHTDDTGNSSADMRLSAERAMAVQDKLVEAHVAKKRLDAVGVGGLQPLADNRTPEGRVKNRRIELVMWQKYPAFHAAAPNGKNYYPTSSDSAANGL